jgi:phosphoenolpyruvate synthase/pyruvate phosphate dikinase
MAMNLKSSEYVLPLADPEATLECVGGKGASLARLVAAGLPVPDGFHVTTTAYRHFVHANGLQEQILSKLEAVDSERPSRLESAAQEIQTLFRQAQIPGELASAIIEAYAGLPGQNPAVAVRSSATAEDLPEASFAGQHETFLNVRGAEATLEATQKCWASLWTARAIGYRVRHGIAPDEVALAVVIQLLVAAESAGIMFTVNPINGARDQVVINAAWGLGEAVVGGVVNPDSVIVDKGTAAIIERQTAAKQVMTMRVNVGTVEQPVPESLRRVPVLKDEAVAELARLGVQIERLYERPMDVEWAWSGGKFAIVQARPITALPEALLSSPDEWKLPEPKGRYMRTSVVDFMPDPLSPLFATMGVPAYNGSLARALVDITRSQNRIFPDDIIVTIKDYAYMRVNFSAGEWWAMLSRLGPRLPGLIRQGPQHFREEALPAYQERVAKLQNKPVAQLSAREIWQDARALMYAAAYHLSILQVDTLGAAAGSEGLFTAIYNRFFRREGDPEASAFLMGYDSTPIRSEKSLYDLAQWAVEQAALSDYVLNMAVAKIADALSRAEIPAGITPAVWAEWTRRIDAHVKSFGHMLYDFDFAKPIPAEDLTPQLETVKMYMRGEGVNPHERQERLEHRRKQAAQQLLQRARGLRGWAVRKALGWAQSLAEVREDSIASIGLAYPRLRELLKELGHRMVKAGAITKPTDIFWLKESEIEDRLDALDKKDRIQSMREATDKRKKIRQAEQKLMPPAQLPYSKTYLGIPVEAFIPGEGGQEGDRLKGVGASGGKVTGAACVLYGPEDFDRMQQGGILVAKQTTPAWTPLFAMAGGVVTDIGGPLSHGSIVAREYGIPAVLGTGTATRVIQSGQKITIDGDAGYVTLTLEE